jgi:phosphohistidine phosphatase
MEILDDLYGSAHPAEVLEAVGWPLKEGTVILVGHQPQLGEIASFLLTRRDEPWPVKKGAIWWFKTGEEGGRLATELFTVIPPKLA